MLLAVLASRAVAGGPRWTAGTAYFNPSAEGQPILWANGSVVYYTDQGALSSYESNSAAGAMVAAAAAPWTQVATAAVTITQGGTLAENVSGANVSGSRGDVIWPTDVESIAKPVAVVYDADGSVLNVLFGAGASDPSGCLTNAVTSLNDGFSLTGNLTHAIVILNGLCAGNATQVANMQYLLTREFGRVLGLDWSQANDNAWTDNPQPSASDYAGWPLMHPINLNCGGDSYDCIPNASALRMDDRAALGRLYPAANFARQTIRIHGTISFANGQGMQGVVVQATRLVTGTTTPDTSMVASCVSGFAFRGNAGNVVTGTVDASGNPLARFGSSNTAAQGEYDLAGLELPAGATSADYELTFSAVNPLYAGVYAVGPDILGTPAPSGTLQSVIIRGLTAGADIEEDVTAVGSATAARGVAGSFAAPNAVSAAGTWSSWLSGYGEVAWMAMSARPNRQFSVLAVAENESGAASQSKAMPLIGAWFADDAAGSLPDFATPQAFDSRNEGTTVLALQTPAGDGALDYPLALAIADARGDGRPDYAYTARVLYADSVDPAVVPLDGGTVAITGMGFIAGDTVQVNGLAASVVSTSAEQLTVQVPGSNATGSVDVEVDDPSGASAVMLGALTYGTVSANSLQVVGVPGGNGPQSGAVGAQAPGSFTVEVVDGNGNPVPNAAVSFSSANGSQLSACGGATFCTVTASNSGIASTAVTPVNAGVETVTASLADGATAQAQWTAVLTPEALQFAQTPLVVEAGQAVTWPLSVTSVANGIAESGATVTFTLSQNGATLATGSSVTNASGVAAYTANVPALISGGAVQVEACLADGTCASIPATGENPAAPLAIVMAGSPQSIVDSATLAPLQLEITDGTGADTGVPGNPLAGASVTFAQTLFSYQASSGGKVPPAKILAQSSATVVSDANGMMAVQPLQQANVAGTVVIVASMGSRVLGTYTLEISPGTAPISGGPVRRRRIL